MSGRTKDQITAAREAIVQHVSAHSVAGGDGFVPTEKWMDLDDIKVLTGAKGSAAAVLAKEIREVDGKRRSFLKLIVADKPVEVPEAPEGATVYATYDKVSDGTVTVWSRDSLHLSEKSVTVAKGLATRQDALAFLNEHGMKYVPNFKKLAAAVA